MIDDAAGVHARWSIARGSLRWGYHTAGDLRACTITRHPVTRRETLTASIAFLDATRARQRPLFFVVLLQHGRSWEWPVETLELTGGVLRATLGPMAAAGGRIHRGA